MFLYKRDIMLRLQFLFHVEMNSKYTDYFVIIETFEL